MAQSSKAGLNWSKTSIIRISTFAYKYDSFLYHSWMYQIDWHFFDILGDISHSCEPTGTMSILRDHWYLCFGLLVTYDLAFKARVDSLTCVFHQLHAMDSSDSPLVWHLLASWSSRIFNHIDYHIEFRISPPLSLLRLNTPLVDSY